LYTGKVGADVSVEEAKEAARICALNALAAVKAEVKTLENVARVVKVTGYVASTAGFNGQPEVMNGASDLLGRLFGEKGLHSRTAVGVAELPLDAPVEVELTIELADTQR
jgi:enamine deaminase RidA (YjgF/YER057c/UK114 family)